VSSSHILYIPLILFMGVVIGFLFARQGSIGQKGDAKRRLELRAERAAKLKESMTQSQEDPPDSD